MQFPSLLLHLAPLLAAAACSSAQTVYLIRHGEKPSDGSNGLSAEGEQRAQCLRSVFGTASQYDIGYILAETPQSSACPPPYPLCPIPMPSTTTSRRRN